MAMYYKPLTTPAERDNIMAGATENQLRRAIAKAQCVELYRQEKTARQGTTIKDWVPRFIEWLQWRYPQLRVSRATLYRWNQLYLSVLDLHHLLDTRGRDNRSAAATGMKPSAQNHVQSEPATPAKIERPSNGI